MRVELGPTRVGVWGGADWGLALYRSAWVRGDPVGVLLTSVASLACLGNKWGPAPEINTVSAPHGTVFDNLQAFSPSDVAQ